MKLSVNENRRSFASRMFLLVFVVLLGTGLTVNGDQPDVELYSEIVHVDADSGMGMMLVCRARGFITSDIILNMKKNGFILTKGDGVETSGVKPDRDQTFWRRDHVIVPHSEVSRYSCEVVHASSSFRVEKVWDPDSDGGRIISSKFIDTTPPDVKMFPENSEVQTNIILTCLVSGFYPNKIILNFKRNGRILTREDGVKSSDIRPSVDNTFQRKDSVEIKKSDASDFSCEVIHAASGSRIEKFWGFIPPHSGEAGDNTDVIFGVIFGFIFGALIGGVFLGQVMSKLGAIARRRTINATDKPAPSAPPPGGNDVNIPLLDGTKESKTSLNSDNSSDSGVNGSAGSGSGASTPSDSSAPDSRSLDSGNDEAENS